MLLQKCGLQYRDIWKNAVRQIREFLRSSCWKACRETPGRQKTHCYCPPSSMWWCGPLLPFHHLSLSLSFSRSFARLPPAAVFHAPVTRLSSRTCKPDRILSASGISASSYVRFEESTPFSDIHPSAVYRGMLYMRILSPNEAYKVYVARQT